MLVVLAEIGDRVYLVGRLGGKIFGVLGAVGGGRRRVTEGGGWGKVGAKGRRARRL